MRFLRVFRVLVLSLFTLTLSACGDFVPPDISRPPAAQRLAVVVVQHGDVFVNGTAISGSRPLVENDKVKTGGNGWARIHFDVGGTLSMEPNSDPTLLLISQAGCVAGQLVVRLWNGTFTAQGVTNVCFDNPTHQATVNPSSDFRIQITDQSFSLNVTRGQVLVSTGPARLSRYVVRTDYGIVVRRGKTTGPLPIIR